MTRDSSSGSCGIGSEPPWPLSLQADRRMAPSAVANDGFQGGCIAFPRCSCIAQLESTVCFAVGVIWFKFDFERSVKTRLQPGGLRRTFVPAEKANPPKGGGAKPPV